MISTSSRSRGIRATLLFLACVGLCPFVPQRLGLPVLFNPHLALARRPEHDSDTQQRGSDTSLDLVPVATFCETRKSEEIEAQVETAWAAQKKAETAVAKATQRITNQEDYYDTVSGGE